MEITQFFFLVQEVVLVHVMKVVQKSVTVVLLVLVSVNRVQDVRGIVISGLTMRKRVGPLDADGELVMVIALKDMLVVLLLVIVVVVDFILCGCTTTTRRTSVSTSTNTRAPILAILTVRDARAFTMIGSAKRRTSRST